MSRPIHVAIVGGNAERGWARDAHVPALARLRDAYLISAVSARSEETARAACEAFGGGRPFGDSLAMVRDPEVDLVAVTVKVPEHRAIVLAALKAGKHVYCEWPLGRDASEAEEMARAVKPSTRVAVGLQGLYAPAVRQAAELAAAGAIGKPKVLRVFSSAAAWGAETSPFNAYLQDKSTGATLETIGGGHTLAAVEALAGPYVEVDARNTTVLKQVPVAGTDRTVERTCADHMLVLGQHQGGCVSTVEVVGGAQTRPALFELVGETGWLRITGVTPGTYQIPRLAIEASFPLEPLRREVAAVLAGPPVNVAELYAAFAQDIATNSRAVPDFAAAARLSRLLEAIDVASATGRRQRLAPLGD
jgi:predicted dehydrogenase